MCMPEFRIIDITKRNEVGVLNLSRIIEKKIFCRRIEGDFEGVYIVYCGN